MAVSVPPEPTPTPAAPASTSTTTGTKPAGVEGTTFNPDEVIDELIESKGGGFQGARLAAKKLLRDKGKLLEKVGNLRARVAEEGSVVLKGDALAEYNKLVALNLTPEQITEKLQQHAELSKEVQSTKQEKLFDAVAESLGLSVKGCKAFARLAKTYALDIQMRDVTVEDNDGNETTVKKPFARVDGKGEYTPLDAVLKKEYGEFLPALYADDDASDGADKSRTSDSGSSRGHAPERKATPMARQSGSARKPPDKAELGAVERTIANRYAPRKAAT